MVAILQEGLQGASPPGVHAFVQSLRTVNSADLGSQEKMTN